jgi:hypothetical protein
MATPLRGRSICFCCRFGWRSLFLLFVAFCAFILHYSVLYGVTVAWSAAAAALEPLIMRHWRQAGLFGCTGPRVLSVCLLFC